MLIRHRFDSLEEFIGEHSSDLSMGGLFLRTESLREVGSLVYLQFSLITGETLIEGLGRVVHVSPPANSPRNSEARAVGIGIEFVNLDEGSLALIEEIVVQRLRGAQARA
jgi:uncharacterized protein (TIGR02266 family)